MLRPKQGPQTGWTCRRVLAASATQAGKRCQGSDVGRPESRYTQ